MRKEDLKEDLELTLSIMGVLVSFVAVLAAISAWLTHILWAVSTLGSDIGATFGQIVLSLLGTFVPPLGFIHGLAIWFGAGF